MNPSKSGIVKSPLPFFLLFSILMLAILLPCMTESVQAAEETVSPFSDLQASDENYPYVMFLQNKSVINGFPDGTFRPFQPLSRAETAKILITMAGFSLQSPDQPTYSDVSQDHWAYLYIETATELGILNGYPDGTFQPQRQLTRAEAAVILYRIYGTHYQWSGDSLAVDLPQWAFAPVNSIIDAGLMGVDAEKRFQPDWATTRVEFARSCALLHTIHEDWRLVPLKATLLPKAGVVQIQKSGQKPVQISEPIELAADDIVITGTKAEAEIRFEDGSGLLLQANSEMKVQKLIGSLFILPDGTEGSAVEDLEVQFLKGSMFGALATRGVEPEAISQTAGAGTWSMFPLLALAGSNWEAIGYSANATLMANEEIAPIDMDSEEFKQLPPWKQLQLKKVRVKVNMPHGVAAVRGSFWKIQLEQIGNRIREIINFIHGEGEVQSGEHSVALRAGEKTAIEEPDAPPTPPEPMTKEEQQEWVAMKEWITERIQEIQERLVAPPTAPPPAPAGQQPPPVNQQAPQPEQQLSPTPAVSQILESLQELLDTMEALEQEFAPAPAPIEDDDDDDSGSDWSSPGDDGPPGVTIKTISDREATITKGDSYSLPATVEAIMSDNTTRKVPVTWTPGTVNTNVPGIHYFNGTVSGYSSKVTLTLTILDSAIVTDNKPVTFYNGASISGLPARTTITAIEVNTPGLVEGIQGAGKAMQFTFSGQLPAEGVILSMPTTSIEAGLCYYNEERGKWELQRSSRIVENAATGTTFAVAEIHHFSIYGPIVKSARLIADSITTIENPAKNEEQLPLPEVPEGFEVSIKSSSDPGIIALDGSIYPPDEETTVELILEVTKKIDGQKAVTETIPVVVPAKTAEPEVPSTYRINYTVPPDITENEEIAIDVTIATLAKGDFGYNRVRLEFGVAGPQGAKATFKTKDSYGKEHTFINEGTWGPPEGFQLPADYTTTTNWRVNFDQPGNYTITFELINLDTWEIIAQGSKAITVRESGLIKSGRIEPLKLDYYEINIQFFEPAIYKGKDKGDPDLPGTQIYLSLAGEDYCLSIVGLSEEGEEEPEVLVVDLNAGQYGNVEFSQLKLRYDLSYGPLEQNRHYYAMLWHEENPEPADMYDLTPLGIATIEVTVNSDPDNSSYPGPLLHAILTNDDPAGPPQQLQPIYLMEKYNPDPNYKTFMAVVPKWPGMANGSWHLTDISNYMPHFGGKHLPSSMYYNPSLSVFEEVYSDNVDSKPVTIEEILDIQANGDTIITLIKASDRNGVEELMTIYQSPSGHLVPSIARKEIGYEESRVWEVITDIGFDGMTGEEGEWSLVGLITKDGANNWVVPSIAGLEHYLVSCYEYFLDKSDTIWNYYADYLCELNSEVLDLPYKALVDGINVTTHEEDYRPLFEQKVFVDFTPPELVGSAINSSFLAPGDTLQLELEILDNCPVVKEIEVWLHNHFGDEQQTIKEYEDGFALNPTISFKIPSDWEPSTYGVDVLLRDAAENYRDEANEQWFSIVGNNQLSIKETTPWYGASEVSIDTPITLSFSAPVTPDDGFEDIELRWEDSVDYGSFSVAEFVYFDETKTTMEIRLNGITLEPGTSYDLFIPQQALVSVDGNTPLPATIFLSFRTKGEKSPIEFPESEEEWVDSWMFSEWWKSGIPVNDLLKLDKTYSNDWFWIQFGSNERTLIKGEDKVLMGPGPMRIWEYGGADTNAFEFIAHTFYLPRKPILFDPVKGCTFSIKGVNLPDKNPTEEVTVELSGWDPEPIIQWKDDVLQITIPGVDDPVEDYYWLTVHYPINDEESYDFSMQTIVIDPLNGDPAVGIIRVQGLN